MIAFRGVMPVQTHNPDTRVFHAVAREVSKLHPEVEFSVLDHGRLDKATESGEVYDTVYRVDMLSRDVTPHAQLEGFATTADQVMMGTFDRFDPDIRYDYFERQPTESHYRRGFPGKSLLYRYQEGQLTQKQQFYVKDWDDPGHWE